MSTPLRHPDISRAYHALATRWRLLDESTRTQMTDSFPIDFAYHSGGLENERITLSDTREIFEHDWAMSFTGDTRTLKEIENLKAMRSWTTGTLSSGFSFSLEELHFCHKTITYGTYDERRWSLGERPGQFKHHRYEVADGVGDAPEDVPSSIEPMLLEVREALVTTQDARDCLTIA